VPSGTDLVRHPSVATDQARHASREVGACCTSTRDIHGPAPLQVPRSAWSATRHILRRLALRLSAVALLLALACHPPLYRRAAPHFAGRASAASPDAIRPSPASLLRLIIPPGLPSPSQCRWGGVGASRIGRRMEAVDCFQIELTNWLISRRIGRLCRAGTQAGMREEVRKNSDVWWNLSRSAGSARGFVKQIV